MVKRSYPGSPEIKSRFIGFEIKMKMFPTFSAYNGAISNLDFRSDSNSQENRSSKEKSPSFENDVNMEEESPEINLLPEDSGTYQQEESKDGETELNQKGFSGESKESRRVTKARKVKESKTDREKMAKRRSLKRSREEVSQIDYVNGIESIRELTRYRSLKIAKEREDIVDPRNLVSKVLLF